jgi:hypothetical protein
LDLSEKIQHPTYCTERPRFVKRIQQRSYSSWLRWLQLVKRLGGFKKIQQQYSQLALIIPRQSQQGRGIIKALGIIKFTGMILVTPKAVPRGD